MGKQVASPNRQADQAARDEAQKNAAPGPDENVGTGIAESADAYALQQLRAKQQQRDHATHAHAIIHEDMRHRPDAGPHLYELQTTGAIIDGVKRAKGYKARLTPAIAKAFQNAGIGLTRVDSD